MAAQAKTGVTFLIVGDTLTSPFTFTNTSDAGEEIVGFGFDLSTLTEANFLFDTEGGGSTPFTPVGTTAQTTGLVALPNIPDNAKSFAIAFSDFDPGEVFSYRIDVDINAGGSIGGQRLIGAKVFFDFSDGTRSEGFLRAAGVRFDHEPHGPHERASAVARSGDLARRVREVRGRSCRRSGAGEVSPSGPGIAASAGAASTSRGPVPQRRSFA